MQLNSQTLRGANESAALRLSRLAVISLAGLLGLLAWDASGLDLWAMQAFGGAEGFAWRDAWWLQNVLHDGGRKLATAAYVALLLLAISPWQPRWAPRWPRAEVAMAVTLGLLAVNAIKRNSLTSCPWDLQAFGGVATYVSHWRWGVADGGPGNCFPGGHASAALAFIGMVVPWLASGDADQRRRGLRWLAAITGVGLVFGVAQTVRGAHYPSHTAWTWAICWAAAWLNHGLFALARGGLQRWRRRAEPAHCAAPATGSS